MLHRPLDDQLADDMPVDDRLRRVEIEAIRLEKAQGYNYLIDDLRQSNERKIERVDQMKGMLTINPMLLKVEQQDVALLRRQLRRVHRQIKQAEQEEGQEQVHLTQMEHVYNKMLRDKMAVIVNTEDVRRNLGSMSALEVYRKQIGSKQIDEFEVQHAQA